MEIGVAAAGMTIVGDKRFHSRPTKMPTETHCDNHCSHQWAGSALSLSSWEMGECLKGRLKRCLSLSSGHLSGHLCGHLSERLSGRLSGCFSGQFSGCLSASAVGSFTQTVHAVFSKVCTKIVAPQRNSKSFANDYSV